MQEIINALIDGGVQVAVALAVALIGVAGTWVTAQIGRVKIIGSGRLTVEQENVHIVIVLHILKVVDKIHVDGKADGSRIGRSPLIHFFEELVILAAGKDA